VLRYARYFLSSFGSFAGSYDTIVLSGLPELTDGMVNQF